MQNSVKNLSVVIPVYNEQENIAHLVREIITHLNSSIPYEIVVVDDASTDQTVTLLRSIKNQYPNLRIIQHQKNAGQSAALVSGVRAANYEWIATLDGDGQNNPADILVLINALENATKKSKIVCLGHRLNRKDTQVRKFSSKIANQVRSLFLKDNCPDSGCGIKLFPKYLFLKLPHFKNCHRFLPSLFKQLGADILMVPVTHRPRLYGISKYGVMNRLWVGIVDLFGVAWLMRRSIEVETHEQP